MPMVALLSNAAFDCDTTQLLGAAFEAAWEEIKAADSMLAEESQAALTRELLAKRIIEMAKRGERNPDHLVEMALDHLARSRAASDSVLTTTSAVLSEATPGR